MSFSERYGYTPVSNTIVREQITEPIKHSIINWLVMIENDLYDKYYEIEEYMWLFHFNLDARDYYNTYERRSIVLTRFIDNNDVKWFEKLNTIEFFLSRLTNFQQYGKYISYLNMEFERHNFAYRIINGQIEEITSEQEIRSIEEAIETSDNVGLHLMSALKNLSAGQVNPDYRNSVKESISAVETCCRSITNKNTLGDALFELEKQGISIHPQLKQGFSNIYNYTNDKKTGIRHALITADYIPTADDAIFMLVICSAFINYVTKKVSTIKPSK